MSCKKEDEKEDKEDKALESASTGNLVETVKQLQIQVETAKQLQIQTEKLRLELSKSSKSPSKRISIVFLVIGASSLVFSVAGNSQVLAFIGLSLVFWGALFLYVRPLKYVQSGLLDSTAIASYSTIDRIIKDLKYKGQSYYIPPYPKDVYLPKHLQGLKDMIVFISADSGTHMPAIEEMAKGKFLVNPDGICIAPPGLGLATQLEKEMRTDITRMQLSELCESLPQTIMGDFQLAKEVGMKQENDQVYLRIFDSVYKDLYSQEEALRSIHFLGCPLVSAILCVIAKTTGKIVTISRDRRSLDGQLLEVWCGFMEG